MDLAGLRRRYASFTWVPEDVGLSAASVFRLEGPEGHHDDLFAKLVGEGAPPRASIELRDEADRLRWLAGQGIPVPAVVELVRSPDLHALITRAVPGRTAADGWPFDQRLAVADAIADVLSLLHALEPSDCPYDRSLAVSVPAAHAAVQDNLLDLDDLDPERAGWSSERLLRELDATLPAEEDIVVCHGDFCLPNIVLDPQTLRVSGLVDVGRAGRADRHADLALMCRSLIGPENPQYEPALAERFLRRYTGSSDITIDPARLDFYRLLDEFY